MEGSGMFHIFLLPQYFLNILIFNIQMTNHYLCFFFYEDDILNKYTIFQPSKIINVKQGLEN